MAFIISWHLFNDKCVCVILDNGLLLAMHSQDGNIDRDGIGLGAPIVSPPTPQQNQSLHDTLVERGQVLLEITGKLAMVKASLEDCRAGRVALRDGLRSLTSPLSECLPGVGEQGEHHPLLLVWFCRGTQHGNHVWWGLTPQLSWHKWFLSLYFLLFMPLYYSQKWEPQNEQCWQLHCPAKMVKYTYMTSWRSTTILVLIMDW